VLNEKVELLYRKKYWTPLKLSNFDQDIANQVYDMSVNHGHRKAGKVLQHVLNDWLVGTLTIDGLIGIKTLGAYKRINQPKYFNNSIVQYRVAYYFDIYENNTTQGVFMQGWIKRAMRYFKK
jgi:lysozyme family protein